MSKTVRISDELYNAIDDYRKKDQTFQEVIKEMAEDIGLLPAKIKDLDDLKNKLENLYGYNSKEVGQVLDALRTIYIGQETESTIGIPHEDVESDYGNEVDALQRLGLVKENHYTGKYDYGYRTTPVGDKIGSEYVRDHIDEYENELRTIFNSYGDAELSVILNFGFEKTDTNHLSSRYADLSKTSRNAFPKSERLQQRYQTFSEQLLEIGLAVSHSENHFTILPPEFGDYLQTLNVNQTEALRKIEIYKTIKSYAVENVDSREELLEQLDTATEDDLEEVIATLHEEGLTSRYIRRDEAPFLVKDKDRLLDRIHQIIDDAVIET